MSFYMPQEGLNLVVKKQSFLEGDAFVESL